MTHSIHSHRQSGEESTHTIDLTGQDGGVYGMPTHVSVKRHHHFRSQPSFTSAYHRVISRQEREYDRTNPDLVRERIDVAEELRDHPVRQQALSHVTRAYVAIGYTHATLTIIVSAICAALLLAVSYAVASDVARKTRDRAADLLSSAAECAARARQNNCVVEGDHVSHPSYEMAALCKKWVSCARRGQFADSDARSAKVWAETLADIVNTFAERLSVTTVIVTATLLIVAAIFFSSSAFNFLHQRVVDDGLLSHQTHAPSSSPYIAHSPMRIQHPSSRRSIADKDD